MSMEVYEQMLVEREIDDAISEAEAEYRSGVEPVDAKEALEALRRKHFG